MSDAVVNATIGQTSYDVTTNATTSSRPYDARGAMMFTVATILLYAMSIIAFIAGNLRRRHTSKEEESQILKYLKQTDDIRRKAVMDDVLRLRSQLLADSIISDNASYQRRKSRVERARLVLTDINCVTPLMGDEISGSSTSSSIELPAVTIAPPTFQDVHGSTANEEPDPKYADIQPEVAMAYPSSTHETSIQNGVCSESERFLKLTKSARPRCSLKESLQHSLLNGDLPNVEEDEEGQTAEEEDEEDEDEESVELQRYRQYRDRRRGVHRLPT